MNEQISKYIDPAKNFWGNQSKKRKGLFIGILIGIVVIALGVTLFMNFKQYTELFRGISPEESAQVAASLVANGTSYKMEDGGTTILVDKKEEQLVRMQLATEGFPKTAPSYGFFKDNVDFMTTESSARTIKLYQLQEYTRQTIKQIQSVEDAVVAINAPDNNGWAWEEDKLEATASVQLILANGVSLDPGQVSGIKHLVSSSVPGLAPESVVVTDQTGAELTSTDKLGYVDVNNMKRDIEKQHETKYKRNIMSSLAPVFGSDNVTAAANVKTSLDKKAIESIIYSPPIEGETTGLPNKSQTSQEQAKGSTTTGGTPGVDENADVAPNYAGNAQDDPNNIYFKTADEYEFALNKVTEQTTIDTAKIEDVTIGVQINARYKLLTEAEIESYKQLIANICGTSVANVAINNPEFMEPIVQEEVDNGILDNKILIYSVSGGVLLLFICLLVVLAINKKLKKKKLAEAQAALAANALTAEEQINGLNFAVTPEAMPDLENELMNAPESKENVLRKEIQEFSGKNPEIVAQLLRTWLRGDDGENA